ncbi:MAG: recombinase family protein [Thermodesulfobacteriota bacterium]
MAEGKFVSYLRVSTAKQGKDGYGMEAQRRSIEDFLNGGKWTLLAEYVEVESGRKSQRPQLEAALRHCDLTGATLVIAKMDRLSRDAHFLLGLQRAGVRFLATDNPHANELTVGLLAVIAEDEARRISARTKAALAAAKSRGVKLGNPKGAAHLGNKYQPAATQATKVKAREDAEKLRATVLGFQAQRVKGLQALADAMNAASIRTPRGGSWYATSVKRLLSRLGMEAG